MVFSGFGHEKTKPNKANIMVHSSSFIVHRKDEERLLEKTKPILQFIVRRLWFIAKTKEKEVEKTKPICRRAKLAQTLY